MKILIACSGTGGHFYPGFTFAKYLQQQNNEVVIYLTKRYADKYAKLLQENNIEYVVGNSPVLPNKKYKYLFFIFVLFYNVILSACLLKKHKICKVVSMGSFANFSISIGAFLLRKKLYLHEGNTVVGKANFYLSKLATKLMYNIPLDDTRIASCPTVQVGMPLRMQITKVLNQEMILNKYDIKTTLPIILVFGGSQGAEAINEAFRNWHLKNKAVYPIHLTGKDHYTKVSKFYETNQLVGKVISYTQSIEELYTICDIILCRAGASSFAELAYFKKCCIIIPFMKAADNHQFKNALYYQGQKACSIILEDDLLEDNLTEIAVLLKNNNSAELRENIGKLAINDTCAKMLQVLQQG